LTTGIKRIKDRWIIPMDTDAERERKREKKREKKRETDRPSEQASA
jgi:hypothetical protein